MNIYQLSTSALWAIAATWLAAALAEWYLRVYRRRNSWASRHQRGEDKQ